MMTAVLIAFGLFCVGFSIPIAFFAIRDSTRKRRVIQRRLQPIATSRIVTRTNANVKPIANTNARVIAKRPFVTERQ